MRHARVACAALGLASIIGCATAPSAPPAPSARQMLRAAIDSFTGEAQFRNAHFGVLVVDPTRGDTLYSRNAGKLFMPASNMKIVTSAVALTQLGPTFRFRTTFAASGRVENGTLDGDLVVIGSGDPTFSAAAHDGDALAPLHEIADSLSAHGVHRITGRVIAGAGTIAPPALGFGWSWDDLTDDYSAGVESLMFNEGAFQLVLAAPGSTVMAGTSPSIGYPSVAVDMRVIGPSEPGVRVHALPFAGDTVRVRGTLRGNRADTLGLAYPSQSAAFLAAMRAAMHDRGIVIDRRSTTSAASPTPLFTYDSRPLVEILPLLMKPSQNQIAEILLRTIGYRQSLVGSADSGAAVERRQLIAWGASDDGFIIRDGSGLSRYDFLSPETLVHVLAAIERDSAFAAYYAAMPVAGVDGTLRNRMKGTPAQNNVHAKTGSIANARSLSGYVNTADGRRLIFSVLSNNFSVPASRVTAVADSIAARLAALDERRR